LQESQWQHRGDDGHGFSKLGRLVLSEVRRDGIAAVVQGGDRAWIGFRTETDVDRPRGVEAKVGPVLGVGRVEFDRLARVSWTTQRSLDEQPTLRLGDIVGLRVAKVGVGVDDNTVQLRPQKIQHGGAHHGGLGAVDNVFVDREPRPLGIRESHAAILTLALAPPPPTDGASACPVVDPPADSRPFAATPIATSHARRDRRLTTAMR
jgi:hypothetical protein